MIETAVIIFSIAVVATAAIVFFILVKIFIKDHFKLAIVLSMEVASLAVLLNAGKSMVVDFAVKIANVDATAKFQNTNPTSWEYLIVVALMALVTIVALFRAPSTPHKPA
jgi:hypothetical protein